MQRSNWKEEMLSPDNPVFIMKSLSIHLVCNMWKSLLSRSELYIFSLGFLLSKKYYDISGINRSFIIYSWNLSLDGLELFGLSFTFLGGVKDFILSYPYNLLLSSFVYYVYNRCT